MHSHWIWILLLAPAADAGTASFESTLPEGVQGLGWQVPVATDPAVKDRCDRIYRASQRLARHLLASVHPWEQDRTLVLATESRSTENWIRPNAGIACGLAFLCRFGPYDEGEVGLPREALLREKILPMMRYLTQTHVTGPRLTDDGKKWGDAWQSAFWARMLGRAAWHLGPDLPQDLADQVRRVVGHEADRIAGAQPPHQIEKDTKAEENAWNSTILSMAAVLMPGDPRRPGWERAFQKWALSAFLRPADEHSVTRIDGRPVSEQFTGANIYDDFTLENHNIVHPDYMTTFSLLLGCSLDYAMTGRRPPGALMHNLAGLYENLTWFALPDGGFVYPSGQDWALFRNPDWLFPHLIMAVFGGQTGGWVLSDRSLEALERMQARTASGRIYLPEENFFASAESDKLYQLGMAWLALHYARDLRPADPERRGVRRLASARIILHRTPSAVHTLSWAAPVMAQCVAYRPDRVVSPHPRSGVGYVRAAGQSRPLEVRLRDARVVEDGDGFTAELEIDHGEDVRADLLYRSRADGAWLMRERLTAKRDVRLEEIATGLVGILNNRHWIHERGEREVMIGGDRTVVSACSGRLLRAGDVSDLSIDSVLFVKGARPLRVCYRGATGPERGRATDELYLNHIEGERNWTAGQTLSEFEAVMRCSGTASAPSR